MAKDKIDIKHRFQVFGLILIYLLVASGHIFYLSQITSSNTSAYNSIFKRKLEKVQSLSFVERTDKATLKETTKKAVSAPSLISIDLLFSKINTNTPRLSFNFATLRAFHFQPHSYLSLRVFRL
jgi:hypothetical protein